MVKIGSDLSFGEIRKRTFSAVCDRPAAAVPRSAESQSSDFKGSINAKRQLMAIREVV